jgi:DNA-binding HxlR family transcriptional regulator
VRSVSAGPPVRVLYALSAAGKGFGAVSRAISRWGQRFAAPAAGASSRTPPARTKAMAQRRPRAA